MDVQDGEAPATAPDGNPIIKPDLAEPTEENKISKNQLRKLRRRQQWEAQREDRKIKRKEKRHARAERKKEELKAKIAEAELQGIDPKTLFQPKPEIERFRVPVAIVIDNDFHKYMHEKEFISITSQLTRCYSENRKAPFYTHLVMSDWKGPLLDRFENVLKGTYKNWTGVHLTDGDFIAACQEATRNMETSASSDTICDALSNAQPPSALDSIKRDPMDLDKISLPDVEEAQHKNIVYLTAESPYTIDRLEPNTCYVVGGIVDRNREKGLCYSRAKERRVRTAKLPIGEYLQMATRKVLATNHVVEIMLKWLESGNWGKAFLEVIPKRKGGQLKDSGEGSAEDNGDAREVIEAGDEEGSTALPENWGPQATRNSEKEPSSEVPLG